MDGAEAVKPVGSLVEQWLAGRNRTAGNLLAAFRVTDDTNYLHAAAAEFPNDPMVQLAILSGDFFPNDRRLWLDRFRESTPAKSLANYLSAEDYLKQGRTNDAIAEFLAGSEKAELGGSTLESMIDLESLARAMGMSDLDSAQASISAMSGELMPQFRNFKVLSQGMKSVSESLVMAGDVSSAQNVAHRGFIVSQQLRHSESGKLLITQMVADSLEANAIAGLEQDQAYDFLDGRSPAELARALRDKKASNQELTRQAMTLLPTLSESEFKAYLDRLKVYGEMPAMRWLVEQKQSAN